MNRLILVVEDQEDNRQIIRDMLSATDYEITKAENGEQALAAVAKQRPEGWSRFEIDPDHDHGDSDPPSCWLAGKPLQMSRHQDVVAISADATQIRFTPAADKTFSLTVARVINNHARELVINMKTANALGVAVPNSLGGHGLLKQIEVVIHRRFGLQQCLLDSLLGLKAGILQTRGALFRAGRYHPSWRSNDSPI